MEPFSHPNQKITINDDLGTSANTATSEQQQTVEGSSTSQGMPIGDLILKAKKAASSLWTVLHAQSCTNNSGSKNPSSSCNHPGCDVTKRLLSHIKSCPAAFDELPCPTNIQGCQTVRKLLNHYKTCRHSTYTSTTNGIIGHQVSRDNISSTSRTIRSSNTFLSRNHPQNNSINYSSSNKRQQQQQHQCLVCSLVARHARNALLEGGGGRGSSISKVTLSATTVRVPAKLVQDVDKSGSSNHFSSTTSIGNNQGRSLLSQGLKEEDSRYFMMANPIPPPEPHDCSKLVRSESMKLMPPPPPRPSSLKHQLHTITSSSQFAASTELLYGTPPTYHQLLHPAIVSAAACVASPKSAATSSAPPPNIKYGSTKNNNNNISNEQPLYRRPRSQSIDDQLYNQFRKMGGGGKRSVVTSRSTSDLLQHHQISSTSESFCDKEDDDDENYLNHEGEGSLSSEEQYNLEI